MILTVNRFQIPMINYNPQSMAELKAGVFFCQAHRVQTINCVIANNKLASNCQHFVNWCLAVCNASILVWTIWWQYLSLHLPIAPQIMG